MNWVTVQEAIRLAIANAAGLPDVAPNGIAVRVVEWANRKTGVAMAPGPRARLTLRNLRGKGQDETRAAYDEGTDTYTVNLTGSRLFTVSVRFESNSQEPGQSVTRYAGQLLTRISRRSVLDALRAAGVALVDVGRAIDADFKDADGRWLSSAIVEVSLHVAENDADTTGEGDFVAIVQGQSHDLVQPSGAPGPVVVIDVDAS